MIRQFHCVDPKGAHLVNEGDTICTGKHTFTFINAPMVHWPEVMVSYDSTDKILFSADAFGTFGALNGALFADEVDFEGKWLDEARRYYTNIVGKYGPQVQNALKKLSCDCEVRLLGPQDFEGLYTDQWSNALCEKRKELDVLGLGAYENGRLVGLAGCSADCEDMWQIGIDVLESHRRKGIASALVSGLALAAMERGKVPFYCAAWSNIRSVRTAIRSGFRPAWVELTVKRREFVDEMNGAGEKE